jgi:hypothetical protein
MNKIYESETMIVHDDREFITPEEAFDILWDGKSIMICDHANYSAEEEHEIFSQPYSICISDIAAPSGTDKEKFKEIVFEFLRGYELSR